MSRLLDKSFRYTPSHSTDVRKTIEREKKRLQALKDERQDKLRTLHVMRKANG